MTPEEPSVRQSSIVWNALEDGFVITKKMSDEQIWTRCHLFGSNRLIEAIEGWLHNGHT